MNPSRRVAVCLFTHGTASDVFQQCLWSILNHTPLERIELRLGLDEAPHALDYALGALLPDGVVPHWQKLPKGIERFSWTASTGLVVRAWLSSSTLAREALTRLLFHDVFLEPEYTICLDSGYSVEAGWWEALEPVFDKGVDYFGPLSWRDYLPGEAEQLQGYPWYMGVPVARREGRLGVSFVSGGFLGVRSQRLREVDFPQPGLVGMGKRTPGISGDSLLGAIAWQLGWTHAAYQQNVQKKREPSLNGVS